MGIGVSAPVSAQEPSSSFHITRRAGHGNTRSLDRSAQSRRRRTSSTVAEHVPSGTSRLFRILPRRPAARLDEERESLINTSLKRYRESLMVVGRARHEFAQQDEDKTTDAPIEFEQF